MTAAVVATAVIVLVMVVASVTFLPAYRGLAGRRISCVRFRRSRADGGDMSRWHRWGVRVTRHPWAYVAGGAAVLTSRPSARRSRLTGLAAVVPPDVDTAAGVATLIAFPTTSPQDGATSHRRSTALGRAPAGAGGERVRARFGGQAATCADIGAQVNRRLPPTHQTP